MPQLGNVGIALAGMRNYVHNLNGAFDGFDPDELRLAMLEPDDIADVFWNLQHTRDRAEQVVGG